VTGYNFRITNVACALLCAQLARATEILGRRREIFDRYDDLLRGIPGIGFQPVASWATPAPWLYCITVDEEAFGTSRDGLAERLEREGIDSRPFFIPLHTLPPFRAASKARGDHLPTTERVASTGLNLPTYSRLDDAGMARIAAAIRAEP
jgi:perosamine synthetase